MTDCKLDKMIPIERVVNSALIDSYETAGKSKELFFHWAARGLKKLQREYLKTGVRRVLLPVNHSTKTATLPPDFDGEIFVGVIDARGHKIPLSIDSYIASASSMIEIPCDDACEKCNQSKSICNDLTTTEETEVIIVNGNAYEKTTIKKLYPNGDYFLEVNTPYYNTVTESVEYVPVKSFITALSLKSCGCLDTTEENIEKLKSCNPDVYSCYYAPCDSLCDSKNGGYMVFEETGLIQLDFGFRFKQLYVEYNGFMAKKNGQYLVPEVAFEALVEWTKFKAIQNKKNVLISDRNNQFQHFTREAGNLEKILGRATLSSIIAAVRSVPVFDIEYRYGSSVCCGTSNPYVTEITSATVSDTCSSSVSAKTSGCSDKCLRPFQIAVVASLTGEGGVPIDGLYTYANSGLENAINMEVIIVNENNETQKAGHFTFDAPTGTITRTSPWVDGDRLIASFAKMV